MPTIEFISRDTTVRDGAATKALTRAAVAARRAPSIYHSQPWRWRIAVDVAELRVDREPRLVRADPDGRMVTISCGAALHHACTALAGAGVDGEVTRLPDPADGELLARIRVSGFGTPAPAAVRQHQAMALRRTDRHLFADEEMAADDLAELRAAAESHGAHLHLFGPDDVIPLAVAAAREETESTCPECCATAEWSAPPDGAAGHTPNGMLARPIRVFDFALGSPIRRAGADQVDRRARYAMLFTDEDTVASWLAAGEALSAVLLTATVRRLAVSPVIDVVGVPTNRQLLRELLAGLGYPSLALRVGVPHDGAASRAARRTSTETVPVVEPG